MAKKKLSRKEQKEQERQMIVAKRQERAWVAPEPGITSAPSSDAVEDMASLFSGGARPSRKDLDVLMQVVVESAELIEEPEFEEVIFDPLVSAALFISGAEARGIDPAEPEEVDESEWSEVHLEILAEVATALVTRESRQEVVDALENLRLRLKEEGQGRRAARVAALQVAMQTGMSQASDWADVALVQAITAKSIGAGFELMATTAEILDQVGLDLDDDVSKIWEQTGVLSESEQGKQLHEQLKRIPGLDRFMEKQTEEVWNASLRDLFSGELALDLYREEELEQAQAVLGEFLSEAEGEEERTAVLKADGATLMERWQQLITELMTAERLEALRVDLQLVLDEGVDLEDRDMLFIRMAINALEPEDAVEYEMPFFLYTLLGELKDYMRAEEMDEYDASDEEE